ncbi:MAG: hypothetical protein RL154_1505, partial [Pseudomonadota bacterium]
CKNDILNAIGSKFLERVASSNSAQKDIIFIQGEPNLIVAAPILPSSKIGTPRGIFVFVRNLDAKFLVSLSDLFDNTIYYKSIFQIDYNNFSVFKYQGIDVYASYIVDDGWSQITILPNGKNSIFALTFNKEYDFLKYGTKALNYLLILTAFFIILTFVVLYLSLGSFILNRLQNMSLELKTIAKDENKRLTVYGADEITNIAVATNELLDSIKNYQNTIRQHNTSLQEEITQKVTELRQKDAVMLRQSRFATIGETIANIAHQWRQPLNNLWLLLQQMHIRYNKNTLTPQTMNETMDDIKKLINYMSHTIDDFRDFFSPDKEKINFCMNEQILKALEMLAPALQSSDIAVEYDLKAPLYINGSPGEFSQVLMILINNAKDALKLNSISNPLIKISANQLGNNIVLEVCDNAGGINSSIFETLFDAYATTKHKSGGTGLGLYLAKTIITTSFNGTIEASNYEQGAKFTITILHIGNSNEI